MQYACTFSRSIPANDFASHQVYGRRMHKSGMNRAGKCARTLHSYIFARAIVKKLTNKTINSDRILLCFDFEVIFTPAKGYLSFEPQERP